VVLLGRLMMAGLLMFAGYRQVRDDTTTASELHEQQSNLLSGHAHCVKAGVMVSKLPASSTAYGRWSSLLMRHPCVLPVGAAHHWTMRQQHWQQ
jgi:hypothetical protein